MSNYVNTTSIAALGAALPALGIVLVALRFAIRIRQKQGIGWDDWFILPSLFFTIGTGACMIYGARAQVLGAPMGDVTLEDANAAIVLTDQLEFAMFLANVPAIGFAKLSIVCFYRRIFHTGSNKAFDITTKVLMGVIALWIAGFFFAFLFQCGTNIALQWGAFEDVVLYCAFVPALNSCYVGTDALVDIVLFILPLPLIAKLKLSRARRIGIMLVFCTGALTVVASVIRVVFLGLAYAGIDSDFTAPQDIDYSLSIFLYWSMLETGLAVIVACLPTFQILLRKVSAEAVSRNVRGIFSLQSFSRRSQRSGRTDQSYEKTSRDTSTNASYRDVETFASRHDIEHGEYQIPAKSYVWDGPRH